MSNGRHRYEALDALRGVCALCVCLFHFKASGPLVNSGFVRGSWLFVDFFFVLSGFVMACSWGNRFDSLGSVGRFMLLRVGRVYPLHLVMLLAFLAMELVGMVLASKGVMSRQPFDAQHSIAAWLASAAMLQIFGFFPHLTWNHPSWSIAAEFWTYLLFGGMVLALGRRSNIGLVLGALAAALFLGLIAENGINATAKDSLWRCVYGFAIGALTWRLTVAGRKPWGGTPAELLVVAMVVSFVTLCSDTPYNLAAPLVFALAVHVFAGEAGRVSALLNMHWPQRLGLWSYSIYMVHVFVQARMDDALKLIGKALHVTLTTSITSAGGVRMNVIGTTPLGGTVFSLLMLLLVVLCAAISYRLVEVPGQRWAKALAARLQPA